MAEASGKDNGNKLPPEAVRAVTFSAPGALRDGLNGQNRMVCVARTRLLTAWGTAAMLGTGLVSTSPALADKAAFNGLWSVLIITEEGECDRAYRYTVRVADGSVSYAGEPGGLSFAVTGRADDRGRVNVSISRGRQTANGNGRLSGKTGAGQWKGRSSVSECSGRWEAELRGK